jgi:hypothetical protein
MIKISKDDRLRLTDLQERVGKHLGIKLESWELIALFESGLVMEEIIMQAEANKKNGEYLSPKRTQIAR